MVTTLLELAGMALLVVAAGLTFGIAAALAAGGVALLLLGVLLEAGDSTSSSTRAEPQGAPAKGVD